MKHRVAGIVDYGFGNHASIRHCLESLGMKCKVSKSAEALNSVDLLVLPGVGAFQSAMKALDDHGLTGYLKETIPKKPTLGICLGMQLLADVSYEHGKTAGLGIIEGEVRRLPPGTHHIGWSSLEPASTNRYGLGDGDFFYFNHTYFLDTTDKASVLYAVGRSVIIPAVVKKDNVVGMQFHPEKSQDGGGGSCIKLSRNWSVPKKRIIGVITVLNGRAVQSSGYRQYLPLGSVDCVAENLDRWGADEILVQCIDRTRQNLGPDFATLDRLAKLGLATPLVYAGGIRDWGDGVEVIRRGADRICVDALLWKPLDILSEITERLGAQALIAAFPLVIRDRALLWRNYLTDTLSPVTPEIQTVFAEDLVSEALLIDMDHEGTLGGFDPNIIKLFPPNRIPIIAFGGISTYDGANLVLSDTRVAAVAIGNSLNYTELAIQGYKEKVENSLLRPAKFRVDKQKT